MWLCRSSTFESTSRTSRLAWRGKAPAPASQPAEVRGRWIGLASSLSVHLLLLTILAFWTLVQASRPVNVVIDSSIAVDTVAPPNLTPPISTEVLAAEPAGDPYPVESVGLPDPINGAGGAMAELIASDRRERSPFDGRRTSRCRGMVSEGLGGGVGTLKFFGSAETGRSFVFVVDCSGSMQGRRIERALEELTASMGQLKDRQQFFIVFFNGEAIPLFNESRPKLHRATLRTRRRTENWLKQVTAGGSTHPEEAIALHVSQT